MIRTATYYLFGLCLCGSIALLQPALAADKAIAPDPAGASGHNAILVMQGLAPNAREGFTRRAIRLSYATDNLSDPEATGRLHQRIEAAAKKICHYNGLHANRTVLQQIDRCQAKSVSEALAMLEIPE